MLLFSDFYIDSRSMSVLFGQQSIKSHCRTFTKDGVDGKAELPVLPFISPPKTPYEDVNADSQGESRFGHISPHVRKSGFRIPECGKFCSWNPKSGKTWLYVKTEILGLGIRNTVERIRNPTKDWNPESKFH